MAFLTAVGGKDIKIYEGDQTKVHPFLIFSPSLLNFLLAFHFFLSKINLAHGLWLWQFLREFTFLSFYVTMRIRILIYSTLGGGCREDAKIMYVKHFEQRPHCMHSKYYV